MTAPVRCGRAVVGVLGLAVFVCAVAAGPAHPAAGRAGRSSPEIAGAAQGAGIEDTIAQYPGYGEYVGVDPQRVLDTRDASGGTQGPVDGGERVTVAVTAPAAVPDDAWAIAANITVTEPTAAGFLTAVPGGASFTDAQGQPVASNLNFEAGQTVPNLAVIGVFGGGTVSMQLSTGSGHVVVDVVGYFIGTSAERGARLTGIEPRRVLDTRAGTSATPIAAAGTVQIDLSTLADSVTAVALNVTATEGSEPSYLTVYGSDLASPPNASSLTVVPGVSRPNLVFTRLSADQRATIFNFAGNVHVVVDLVGTFTAGADPSTKTGRVVARSVAYRSYDTRRDGSKAPLGATAVSVNFHGLDVEVGADVQAVIMNVTATGGTSASYLSVYPATGPSGAPGAPEASTLNWGVAETNPNLGLVTLGPEVADGKDPDTEPDQFVGVFNFAGTVHFLFDESAYVLA